MRYLALAADYDGTLAHHGRLDEPTVAALTRLRESGRRRLMVTGRELDQLLEICPHVELFDLIVAENGALLYNPATREERVLAEPPPPRFAELLRSRGARDVSVGRVIVATWEPHEVVVLETIHELGLELQVIFNKGAVMVLPSGVNKASGLAAALAELGLSPHNVVGVGDAENDHAMLALCECGVCVANGLPAVKERADLVTRGHHGAGVAELIEGLLADDLESLAPRLARHAVLIGRREDGREELLQPYGVNVLVAGSSAGGKSTLTTGLLERLSAAGYQFVIIDPEGDYSSLEHAAVLGDPTRPPLTDEVLDLLKSPAQNVVVNLLGVALEHRPAFFAGLLPRLQAKRASKGRPHWVVVDEAHHLIHADRAPTELTLPRRAGGLLFVTVHPESMAKAALEAVDVVLAVGDGPAKTLAAFCQAAGHADPGAAEVTLRRGEALLWRRADGSVTRVRTEPPRTERKRHSRKYAEGNLGPDRSFYFRGPGEKLKLKAQNLVVFLQMADGVDDETWTHHLKRGEYSEWFREGIKDDKLAAAAAEVEAQAGLTPAESRAAIRAEVEKRYTLPADRPSGQIDPPGGPERGKE